MDNGLRGGYDLVYNGEGVPRVRYFEATITSPGRAYRFYVIAVNSVGDSPASDLLTAYACEEPSGVAAPTKVAVTQGSVSISWTQPTDDGGCPITSYSILRDGGPSDDAFVEVHGGVVNDNPQLYSYTVTDLPPDILGLQVRFKIRATNQRGAGGTSQDVLAVIIADVPDTPT